MIAVIEVTTGEPVTGLWCGECLLPSVAALPVTTSIGSATPELSVFKGCADCGRLDREDW